MHDPLTRRGFTALAAGSLLAGAQSLSAADAPKPAAATPSGPPNPGASNPGPVEAPFERDYPAPDFKPSWKRPQLNRLLVQDFVIYAHSDLDMTKKLLEREPGLIAASMNWGTYD